MFESEYIKKLKPYVVSSQKAWEIEDKSNVLKLDWNESTTKPSPLVYEYLKKFLDNGYLNWYPNLNNKKLLKLLSDYNQLPEQNIQYFPSSDSIHEYLVRIYINPEDVVTIIAPTYDNFRVSAESLGAQINYFYLDTDFKFNYNLFKEHIKNYNPKIVYLCNPNNPTGTSYTINEIETLIKEYPNVLFIVDEAYYEFTKITAKDLVLKYHNIFITRTFSKAFALASFRIGYLISSEENLKIVSKIRNPKNITSFSQVAAIAALSDLDYMENNVKEILDAKIFLKEKLAELNIRCIANGGNFALIILENGIKDNLIKYLEDNNIFVRNYSHVSTMEKCIRITIGNTKQMDFVYNIIKNFFDEKNCLL